MSHEAVEIFGSERGLTVDCVVRSNIKIPAQAKLGRRTLELGLGRASPQIQGGVAKARMLTPARRLSRHERLRRGEGGVFLGSRDRERAAGVQHLPSCLGQRGPSPNV